MAINENMVANIVKPSATKIESLNSSMSNGQMSIVRTIVGNESAIEKEYKSFCAQYGTITELKAAQVGENSAFIGLNCIVSAASYDLLAPGMARCTQTYLIPNYNEGIKENVADAVKEQHFETSDVSVTERNVRYAPFWVKAFQNDTETEAKAWKAIQNFLDTTVESKEEAATLLANSTAFVDGAAQKLAIKKMVCLRMGGVDAFYYPVQTVSVSDVSKEDKVGVGEDVGTISEPSGLKKITLKGGLEWLKMSDKVSWDGTSFHIEQQWAGAQSWDKDLYASSK